MDAQSITELRAQRFAFLREIYEVAAGSTSSNVHQRDIAASLGYDEELADKIGQYLVDEGLLEFFTFGPRYVLTHEGVEEVEAALAAPDGRVGDTTGQPRLDADRPAASGRRGPSRAGG